MHGVHSKVSFIFIAYQVERIHLLGGFVPRHLTRASPLDPTWKLPSLTRCIFDPLINMCGCASDSDSDRLLDVQTCGSSS